MAEYIERERLLEIIKSLIIPYAGLRSGKKVLNELLMSYREAVLEKIQEAPVADVAPVRHGRWILEAHDERVNYRWNVTAECSECCDEQKEIWAGFFPNVPPSISRSVALVSAESVKLSNYCPNCGAKMDEEK